MGLAGLTAVFGMGTGVAPPVCSPGRRPGGGQAPAVACGAVVGPVKTSACGSFTQAPPEGPPRGIVMLFGGSRVHPCRPQPSLRRRRVGVVKSLGC